MQKNTKRKKKLKFKIFARLSVISIILLYFLLQIFPFFSQASNKTYIVEYGKIEEIVSIDSLVARDEKVISHITKGQMVLSVKEGERVRKGQEIATIYFDNLDEKTLRDLEIINLRIENVKNKQSQPQQQLFQRDIEKIEGDILTLTQEIQQYIRDGNYEKIYSLKDQLSLLVEKKSIINGEKSFAGKNLDELQQQQKFLEEKVNTSLETIYSEYSGIVALGSDGLEELLTLKALDDFSLQQYETIKNSIGTINLNNEEDDILYLRLIKNHKWSIITILKEKDIEGLQEGKSIKLRLKGQSREYKGVVRNMIQEGEQWIVILDLTEFIEDYYNKRVITFDMIKNSFEGIMIPNKAIVEIQGKQGVYRLDVNGFSRFVPIKVKGSNREYSIVYNGFFDEDDNGQPKRVNTLNFYDEIVLYPEKINEGDRIR